MFPRKGTIVARLRRITRAAVVAITPAALLAVAGPASAHVTVEPSVAIQGDDAVLTFQVPGEEDGSATTKVQLFVPTANPIASLAVRAVPGWTVVVHKTHLASPVQSDDGPVSDVISDVTWTAAAADAPIRSGWFEQFQISVGPLPKVGELDFKVLQTYADGDVVRWIDLPQPGGAEPAHPAPVLHLTADAAAPNLAPAGGQQKGGATPLDVTATVLGGLGLLAGLGALLRRRPRRADAERLPSSPARVDVEP